MNTPHMFLVGSKETKHWNKNCKVNFQSKFLSFNLVGNIDNILPYLAFN